MIRIAFVSTFPPEPVTSGFAMRIYGILSSVPSEFDVLCVYPEGASGGRFPPDVVFAGKRVSRVTELFSATPVTLLPYARSEQCGGVKNAIEEFNPDLVIVSGLHVFPLVPDKFRIFYDAHNIEWQLSMGLYRSSQAPTLVRLHRYITYLKLKKAEVQLVKSTSRMVACSGTDSEYFSSLRGEAVAVVPNGVDTDYWDIPRSPQKGIVLFSGDMSYYPNIESAVFIVREILPILKSSGWTGKLILCGRDPSPQVLSLESDTVEVTGTVDDLRNFYSMAEVLIAPMRIGSGTPLKVISALAAGVPVVTTRRIADSLDVSHLGVVLLADGPEEMAESMLRLMTDPALAEHYSAAGKKIAQERFSWPVVGRLFWEQVKSSLR